MIGAADAVGLPLPLAVIAFATDCRLNSDAALLAEAVQARLEEDPHRV